MPKRKFYKDEENPYDYYAKASTPTEYRNEEKLAEMSVPEVVNAGSSPSIARALGERDIKNEAITNTDNFQLDSKGNMSVNSLRRKDFHWFTLLESVESSNAYLKTVTLGSVTNNTTYLALATGAAVNDETSVIKSVLNSELSNFSWDKKRSLKVLMQFSDTTSQFGRIVLGDPRNVNGRKIGFSFQDGKIYAYTANGTSATTVEIADISLSGQELYFEYTPSTEVKFYIDGTLKHIATATLPSGNTDSEFLLGLMVRSGGAVRQLSVSYWDFWQAN